MRLDTNRLGGGGSRRRLAVWLLIASLFTLVQVRQSLHGGRLALPPTYDDVGFLRDGQIYLQVLYDRGPVAFVSHATERWPHSPWSSYLATASFLVFGMHEWAPAAANGLLILAVLLWLDRRARGLPARWSLVIAATVLTLPLLSQAIENFRPDLASGLATAALAFYIVRDRWLGAAPARHYRAGLGLGLTLLIKPTISPVTALIVVTALAASTVTDLARGAPRRAGPILAAWVRCMATGAALAAPYYVLAFSHLSTYIYRNTFGELRDVWSLRLSGSEQALYYLIGEGGRMMLAGWLQLWLVLAAAAFLAALARRAAAAFTRVPAAVAVGIVSYLAVTLPGHKHPFLGVVVPSLLLFAAVEMMVYLARETTPRMTTIAGRWLLVALLVTGVFGYRWPYQLTTGGPLTAEQNRQHRQLLETVYQDLRATGVERTRVFFTQISAFLNPTLLEYRAGLDRLPAFSSHDLQLSERPQHLDRELGQADHVVAFSPDNPNAFQWLPGSETQSSILERLEADRDFALTGIYGTPHDGEVYLFTRTVGFRGLRALSGVGSLEGPYPEWNLHTRVRWAMGPVSRFELRLPVDARIRLRWNAQAGFPDQTMTVKISGRAIHRHAFGASGDFEYGEVVHDLRAGRHLVELEHSHWNTPSERDNRPRAVLLRTFTALPYFDASVIVGPVEEAPDDQASDVPESSEPPATSDPPDSSDAADE